ncbi:hypothetical protein D1155_10165 [Anaerotruncus sp. 80]|uniref:Uncharacterized protein n=1 Tax=Anaerotruncus colihominis TaxID=169435 RepID=A0A845QMR6_9FIRM|nr:MULTISPECIES: hypothetical protein [Anaerotruncus]NBH62013.1 hypothetical protein [Anaerotruncus colihominis]NCF02668.1 hypothetical protein [Anaerotruncus sp. 80]
MERIKFKSGKIVEVKNASENVSTKSRSLTFTIEDINGIDIIQGVLFDKNNLLDIEITSGDIKTTTKNAYEGATFQATRNLMSNVVAVTIMKNYDSIDTEDEK